MQRKVRLCMVGANRAIHAGEEDLQAAVLDETHGLGADVVIVAAPSPQGQEAALQLVAIGGRINFFGGLPKDRPTINFDSNGVHYKELLVTGTTACSIAACRCARPCRPLRWQRVVNLSRWSLSHNEVCMNNLPFSFDLQAPDYLPSHWDNHIQRRLSSMKGQFLDSAAYTDLLAQADRLLYEVYEIKRPELPGELPHGVSIVHPGTVGQEFYMTRGHFHNVLDTAEIYTCLQGEGCMVMETPEGDWSVEWLTPGRVLYVPPRWAHRSVNTGKTVDLLTFFIYPGNAGHDYGTIERQGFRKLVIDTPAGPQIIDNPRWCPPGARQ